LSKFAENRAAEQRPRGNPAYHFFTWRDDERRRRGRRECVSWGAAARRRRLEGRLLAALALRMR